MENWKVAVPSKSQNCWDWCLKIVWGYDWFWAHLPCPGIKGLEKWGMMESGGPEGRTAFRVDSWAGAGDWAGEVMGLQSWGLCCNYIKKMR